ncbi:MAG: PBP1A family penicillin-binding protein [Syntrophomonadaceae bacterium]|nr:PBP1A family penicillin-binding protein [Syntrophomonadaceae bacterium]
MADNYHPNYQYEYQKPPQRSKWKVILTTILFIGLSLFLGIIAYSAYALPAFNEQQLTGANASLLYDDQGKIFWRVHAEEDRTSVELEKVPVDLINAFIATEDRDFYNHHGVNYKGIARALLSNIQTRDLTGQGASTITQQLARNAFLSKEKTWQRKVKEILLAYKLESMYSKDEIFQLYLNKIYFGAGAYGVQAAANRYFAKDVSELNLAESALLAGLVQSPSRYDPLQNPKAAKSRQWLVLLSMRNCNFISYSEAEEAHNQELVFKSGQSSSIHYGFFIDAVIDEAVDKLSQIKGYKDADAMIYTSGLKIYTTMDAALQKHAEEYFKDPAHFPSETKNGNQIQVGMAIFDHSNGEIKSIMGGREYTNQRGFNRATNAYRQPGSAIKPLTVYTPALEKGNMPLTVLDDSPISYKINHEVWSPQNYDFKYRGLIPMRTAVQYSINTYAIQMLDKIGISAGYESGKALGLNHLINTPGKNDLGLSPLALGSLTIGASPVEMAAAYGSFGNGGYYVRPHFITKITASDGRILYQYKQQMKRAMSANTAWLMNSMLQTVVNSGTGTNGKVPGVPTGGKTGTSENNNDCWFCGLTPLYSGAIWMGYDEKYTMKNQYGGGYPARLFSSMLQKAHKDKKYSNWTKPQDVILTSVCTKSGKLPSSNCPDDQIISEYCVKKYAPDAVCTIHQHVNICRESGKLATKYCPDIYEQSMVQAKPGSSETSRIPAETCDIHNSFTVQSLFKNTVKVCTDPRHEGKLYQAIIPHGGQSGGCPPAMIKEIVINPGHNYPPCPLQDHQIYKGPGHDLIDN